MSWAPLFTDRPDSVEIRSAHIEAHQAYLRKYKGAITLCGALRPEPDAAPKGGLWLFEAETRAEVEAIIAEDPFQIHGLRATTDIYAWAPAPGFEDVTVAARG